MTSVLSQVRAATAAQHADLDSRLDVFARLASAEGRRQFVAAQFSLHAAVEPLLQAMLGAIDGLSIGARQKSAVLREDLIALGFSRTQIEQLTQERAPALDDAHHALGFAYVLEGATLGGRVIRRIAAARGLSLEGLGYLDAYGEDVAVRWRAFCDVLEREGRLDIEAVVRGAIEGFAYAADILLAPVPGREKADA